MPGIKIVSPMTPKEYIKVYDNFMKGDDVYYVSEHRGSFNNEKEFKDQIESKSALVIYAISITRFEAVKAKKILEQKGITVSLIHILWIKPFKPSKKSLRNLKKSKYGGLVLDDDYESGVAKSLANELNIKTGSKVFTLGLKNKSAGFSKSTDNLPPNANEIVRKVKKIIKDKKK